MQLEDKHVANNTIFLYIRMIVILFVGLYTSRVVLQVLGTEDYGIYGIVGSITALLSFLNASMNGATSRFIAYEIGKNNNIKLCKTFNAAMVSHVAIALFVFIFSETVGLWLLNNKLIIPENRIDAAKWVFHFSVFSAIINITQVPYNATIIAHEKMKVYAYVEILNAILKLLMVFLLSILGYDKLIVYSILFFCVNLIVAFTYRFYCLRNYPETRFHFEIDKDIIKPMLGFSLWDLYSNFSIAIKVQGRNFLINTFFGVLYNAASSITVVILGAVLGFTSAIVQAFKPYIIKLYAQNRIEDVNKVSSNALKYTVLLISLFVVPLLIEIDYVFKLWLGDVPQYAVSFSRCALIGSCIATCNNILVTILQANGNIKKISLLTGTIYCFHIPIMYILFKLGYDATSSYIVDIIGVICLFASNLYVIKQNIPSFNTFRLILSIISSLIIVIPVSVITYYCSIFFESSLTKVIIVTIIYLFLCLSISFFTIVDKQTRSLIINRINIYINKFLS